MLHQVGKEEAFKKMAGTSSFKKNRCVCRVLFLLTFKVSALLAFKASCFDFPFTVVILAASGRKETCARVKEQLQERN